MAGAYLQVGQQLVHLDARRAGVLACLDVSSRRGWRSESRRAKGAPGREARGRIQAGQRVGEGEDEGEGEVRYARR